MSDRAAVDVEDRRNRPRPPASERPSFSSANFFEASACRFDSVLRGEGLCTSTRSMSFNPKPRAVQRLGAAKTGRHQELPAGARGVRVRLHVAGAL